MRLDLAPHTGAWVGSAGTYGALYTVAAGGLAVARLGFPWRSLSFQIKKAAATTPIILFACTSPAVFNAAGQDGYALRFNADGSVDFCVLRDGVLAVITSTAAAVIISGTEYLVVVTYDRQTAAFTITLAGTTLSAVDASYQTLSYFVADCDAGDAV